MCAIKSSCLVSNGQETEKISDDTGESAGPTMTDGTKIGRGLREEFPLYAKAL